MPRYVYKCAVCSDLFEVRHSIEDRRTDCEKCEAKASLVRVPAGFITFEQRSEPVNSGSVVNTCIEEAKRGIKEEKERLTQDYFAP